MLVRACVPLAWPGGPALPRALTRVLGPQSSAVDANAVIWAFFEAHPLDGGVSG